MSHLKPSVPSKSHYKITYRRSPVKYCDCILEWLCALVSMRNIRCCLQQEGEVPSASGGGSDFHNQCGKFPRKWKAQAVQMYSTCEKWSACHHMASGSFAPSQHFCTQTSLWINAVNVFPKLKLWKNKWSWSVLISPGLKIKSFHHIGQHLSQHVYSKFHIYRKK